MSNLVSRGAGASAPAPGRALRRVALGIAYDGAGYHGFAAQPNVRTIGGELKYALARIAGRQVDVVCAGRTDTGVHALAQVIHVDLDAELLVRRYGASGGDFEDLTALARAVDRQLGREAACWRALSVPSNFDARYSATARRYRYELDLDPVRDPRDARRVWRLAGPLDLSAMRLAADPLLGEHDFAAFCRRPPDRPDGPLMRKVTDAHWRTVGWRWSFDIEAKAFCHQMVRSIVGALVAVGEGRLRPSDVVALLRSGSRRGAPTLAPSEGLCLVAVRYPEELGGTWGAVPLPEPWERAAPAPRAH